MPYERKFRIKGIKSTNPIAVGDVVDYELKNLRYSNRYYPQYSREKELHRSKSVNLSHQMHIIVNIDRVFLITINNPLQLLILLIFLVTAGTDGIEILVFNKIDTFDEATLDEQLYAACIRKLIQCRVSSTEMKRRTVERNDDW
jgi:ribosome biogenesis GTPase